MGSTNKTAHYELPQFVANDKPSWLGDFNQAMEAVDTGIFGAKSSADGAQTTANNAVAGVQTANTRMDGMQTQIDTIATQANQTATTVNQHTASIATNSANINTLNSRMGNTDISEIGDGTVTGAIEAISGGGGGGASNVRWNSVTDRFEVLKNGNWVQSIRAFVNSLAVFVAGIFGITVANGIYKLNSTITTALAFSNSGGALTGVLSTNGSAYTLLSEELIDFSNYTSIKVIDSEMGTRTLDVSGFNGTGYLYVAFLQNNSGNRSIRFGVSSTKEYPQDNVISNLSTEEAHTSANCSISEISVN